MDLLKLDDELDFELLSQEIYRTIQADTPSQTETKDSLPFFVKIFNFPFKTSEAQIIQFLKLGDSETCNLNFLCSQGRKDKFRGIVVFKVTSEEVGRVVMEANQRAFGDRTISMEVVDDWQDEMVKSRSRRRGKNKKRKESK